MNKATLPKLLVPKYSSHLIRVGKEYDGGYLADRRDVEASTAMVGIGISYDWSFEEDFYSLNPVPIFAYDASLVLMKCIWKVVRLCLRMLLRPSYYKRMLVRVLGYNDFFSGDRRHISKFGGAENDPSFISVKDVIEQV